MKVARLYRFRASHSLPGVEGYDQLHEHDYTVEVVVRAHTMGEDGMIVDTQRLDDIAADALALEGRDLNEIASPSTVENLAKTFWLHFQIEDCDHHVKVWEDDDRWGQFP